MAGFYFLRGKDEENDKLPGWSKDDLVLEKTPEGKVADALHPGAYLPEIEIVIQDRMFDQNGQLFYTVDPTDPDHPLWTPEFFGNIITVNGKSWPYLSVAPRKYRFHFLDGSNARFYNMWLKNLVNGANGPAMVQVGTDGGMLDSPAVLDPAKGDSLFMSPGERADIIIDFSKVPVNSVLTLMNNAAGPYPTGDCVIPGFTDRIMQFIVNGKMVDGKDKNSNGTDRSKVPDNLRSTPLVKLTDFAGHQNIKADVTRQLLLNEVEGDTGPKMVLLNNSHYMSMDPMMNEFGAVTEKPVEGTTEKWQLINTTMDAHPMHMHLVQFQLVSRQDFDMPKYMHDYMDLFMNPGGFYSKPDPMMGNMYMGGEGPPMNYDVKNTDGAVGGNPAITPYLLGRPIPANPNERGWKDVIKAYPGQIMTYMVRFAPTELPLWWPKALSRFSFDPSEGPGYVWHCHIVEHEDNDMMRPMNVLSNPSRRWVKASEAIADNIITAGDNALFQNSPNPFTTTTDIRFTLANDCHVELVLFDNLGTKIKTLINADASAGEHLATLYADNLPAGVYLYQLKAGSFTDTKKLVLTK